MEPTLIRWMALAALSLLALGQPMAVPAADVMQLLTEGRRATAPGQDMRATIRFEMVNDRGETVQWAGSYYRRTQPDERIRIVLESPADLRGTEVVVAPGPEGKTHTRLYVPSLRRVRDITADMRGESFLGTDFNYEDLGLQQLDYQRHSLSEAKDADGRDCYRIESVPQQGWWYGRIVRCLDRKTFLPLRTEYYDRSDVLWKVRTLEGVQTIASHPTPTVITMQTVPARTLTRIALSDIQYDTGLADYLFETTRD